MAVAYDNSTTAETGAGTSLTFSHTTAGANRGLLVGVMSYVASNGQVASATYGGVSMTSVGSILLGLTDTEKLDVFRLIAPTVGANNVIVTMDRTVEMVAIALSVTGCDQTNMVTASTTEVDDNVTTHEVTVASAIGELVVDFLAWYNNTLTVGGGQTQRINNANGATMESGACSTEPGAASVAMTWTSGSAEYTGHCAVAVKASVVAAVSLLPPPPSFRHMITR